MHVEFIRKLIGRINIKVYHEYHGRLSDTDNYKAKFICYTFLFLLTIGHA